MNPHKNFIRTGQPTGSQPMMSENQLRKHQEEMAAGVAFCSSQPPMEATRPMVFAAVARLDHKIQMLSNGLEDLGRRLAPVLRNEPANPEGKQESVPQPNCDLAAALEVFGDRVHLATRHLEEMFRLLEI